MMSLAHGKVCESTARLALAEEMLKVLTYIELGHLTSGLLSWSLTFCYEKELDRVSFGGPPPPPWKLGSPLSN